MKFDIEYIKQIADVMQEKSLVELEIEENGQRVALKKGCFGEQPQQVLPVAKVQDVEQEYISSAISEKTSKTLTPITSPMVGTFYNSASPDSEPFVSVGDLIKPGQIVCIIEAMKLMNEIEADISGRVVEICVENGQTIEFGQVLMYIE